jgi:hypothetical protein
MAMRFGQLVGKEPIFTGEEKDRCLAVNCDLANGMFGNPLVPMDVMLRWVADWVQNDRPILGKPSKFHVRSGEF